MEWNWINTPVTLKKGISAMEARKGKPLAFPLRFRSTHWI
jgi:hypothetical protein